MPPGACSLARIFPPLGCFGDEPIVSPVAAAPWSADRALTSPKPVQRDTPGIEGGAAFFEADERRTFCCFFVLHLLTSRLTGELLEFKLLLLEGSVAGSRARILG